jgi:hypothetical protein
MKSASSLPRRKLHVFDEFDPTWAVVDRVAVGDQLFDGFDVLWSHFLQHHVELHSLVASSNDQSEQDVHREDEARKVATRQY